MGKLYWARAVDGSYDAYAEIHASRARSRYDGAMLAARLKNALEFGSSAFDEDRMLGSPFFFHKEGREGVFYLIDDQPIGADVTVVWVGDVSVIGIGVAETEAKRRLAELP